MTALQGNLDIGSTELSGASHHFDLGVDVLAFPGEMGALPQNWDHYDVSHRQHDVGAWTPQDPAQLQLWATTLDVPGF
ncbi:MAG: hypothetical protein K0U64_02060 [Actinomycetia bacterium]|nr:hypothetical protein [Actinomycetes bacterium]